MELHPIDAKPAQPGQIPPGLIFSRRKSVTVQVMLGGRSVRMGRDKALVELGGKTLLDRAIHTWQPYGGGFQLSVGDSSRRVLAPRGITAVADVYPDRGPLGGLHAGLRACSTPLLLLTAVDCPFLTPAQADGLLEAIGTADACVYTLEGYPQPLFGLYRKNCLTLAETLLLGGDNRMSTLLSWVHTIALPAPDPALFRNLNTPSDLESAEKEGCNFT